MTIDWAALGSVFGVSLVAVLALVTLFAGGLRALTAREAARSRGGSGTAGTATATACLTACVIVVLFGIYLIVAG
ncbi:hypothetical protein [Saccharothrix coeruleofusca]|uniref:Uncharacterized protein n=1 Tax=Saccharothrix coeruleofusca TaxID=33919 RepID=A0A918AMB3_9PSEU|nr:hypothetical protein [Saccharothrix coeruleofusca]MBP2333830.1 ABC-type nickel/cobalt efflux system permease component RcnA [Saccharothrix coeruleofusca]GGP45511.1 hypothetical protein GCM10010185_16620 [Saccharothrix coeruleofusca]